MEGCKQGNGKLILFFITESLLLLRVDWSKASREDGDQLGGDYSRPGEE